MRHDLRNGPPRSYTLCWDCANATNSACSWSAWFEPVEGWQAVPVHKTALDSYTVISCPQFKRDALRGGLARITKKEEES